MSLFRPLDREDFSSSRHLALRYCWSMIFSENRHPLFGSCSSSGMGQPARPDNLTVALLAEAHDRGPRVLDGDGHAVGIGMQDGRFVAHDRHMALPEQKVAAPQLLDVLRTLERAAQRPQLHVGVARA